MGRVYPRVTGNFVTPPKYSDAEVTVRRICYIQAGQMLEKTRGGSLDGLAMTRRIITESAVPFDVVTFGVCC